MQRERRLLGLLARAARDAIVPSVRAILDRLPYFDARLVEEVFRRRVLQRLHRAERLSEEFQRSLLGWVHSGFSVHDELHDLAAAVE